MASEVIGSRLPGLDINFENHLPSEESSNKVYSSGPCICPETNQEQRNTDIYHD